ncbi:hypothetical protein P4O66_006352 [Electrophorus voltai]|uniref:Uncharacterized protein n=1 Tax=Electrophorus voltai TaxID=2609070 RepID=A0AAD8ZJU1_9TELE|nr:hypothetical protein P4O66_006352 [Electrophorus voltai]
MSHSGTLQRRTTYLISLTLVKVEAVGTDDGTEPTKTLAPTTAPALSQGLEHGAKTREELKVEDISTAPEIEKNPGCFEEQKVEVRGWKSNNEMKPGSKFGCAVRAPPPKAKEISCPLVLSNYKDRELHREIRAESSAKISPDNEDKRSDIKRTETSKPDIYKTEFYTQTPEKASDVVVSNGASVRSSLPVHLSQRPEALLRAAVTMNRRELKEASKSISSSAKSLDCQVREHSPPVTITMTMGPYRASWSESEGRGMYQRIGIEPLMVAKEAYTGPGLVALDSPQVEKLRTISTSLPAPATRPPMKPQRKGKSRTLDNSDLHLLSEDLKKGKEAQVGASAGQRASTHASGKDRKMLKFISGIFTKSIQSPATPAVPATPIPLHRPMQRGSSEEEAILTPRYEGHWTAARGGACLSQDSALHSQGGEAPGFALTYGSSNTVCYNPTKPAFFSYSPLSCPVSPCLQSGEQSLTCRYLWCGGHHPAGSSPCLQRRDNITARPTPVPGARKDSVSSVPVQVPGAGDAAHPVSVPGIVDGIAMNVPGARDASWPVPFPGARDATPPDQVPVPGARDAIHPEPVPGLVVASWPILTTQEVSQSVLVPYVRSMPVGGPLNLPAALLNTVAMPPDPAAPLTSSPPSLSFPDSPLNAAAAPLDLPDSPLSKAAMGTGPPLLNMASADSDIPRVEKAMCQACPGATSQACPCGRASRLPSGPCSCYSRCHKAALDMSESKSPVTKPRARSSETALIGEKEYRNSWRQENLTYDTTTVQGILGSLRSGKSSLVHRYMTGSYLPFESPEGGVFKKEVLIDGQSHILFIREEPSLPDAQFFSWVDGVILVFSLENESSFLEVYNIYRQLGIHCNIAELPFIVVGTQDKITSTNPRVIDDARARQLCSDVHRCTYYETCATYGLNVNRVFTEAAQKIVTMKRQLALYASCKSLPNSPNHSGVSTPVSVAFPVQTSNGGQSSDYSSLPSTPVIGHKHVGGTSGGENLGTATPICLRSGHGRTSRFTVRRGSDSDRRSVDSKDFGVGQVIPIKQV